ncbi:hypothetical protein [Oceanobacillus neutriphilus]|uniref:Uncharacterized protein n=1 Tax=Oceanobacillus neutriphilus TaxID=531815 RepID=A0ABQ2NY77_9BACI|nr:hypothetical protein [Oceanobacillus neutriphilus]GGP13528.1 hypothetical protein GCM10011346_33880 [Oceanobacillus neutriphilus]
MTAEHNPEQQQTPSYPEGMTERYNRWEAQYKSIMDADLGAIERDNQLKSSFINFVTDALSSHDYKEARTMSSDYRELMFDVSIEMNREMQKELDELAESFKEVAELQS